MRPAACLPPNPMGHSPVRLASNKIAEFGRYDSLVGAGNFSFGGSFQFRCPTDAVPKDGTRVGDEGKAVGCCPSPGGFAALRNLTIRSVTTITESQFFVTSRFKIFRTTPAA